MPQEIKNVLLTGAGFSTEFGGPLGSEMAYHLFNSIDKSQTSLLKIWESSQNNYEAFYQAAMDNGSALEKELVSKLLIEIFDRLHLRYKNRLTEDIKLSGHFGVTLDGVRANLNGFDPKRKRFQIDRVDQDNMTSSHLCTIKFGLFLEQLLHNGGLSFFTLNQDLLIEEISTNRIRQSKNNSHLIFYPGIDSKVAMLEPFVLPKSNNQNLLISSKLIPYIKLHGSQQWRSKESHLIITGLNKEWDISNTPLLNQYSAYFNNTLKNAKNLIVIGYSFRDKNINGHIQDALDNNANLKLHLVDPLPYKCLYRNMRNNGLIMDLSKVYIYPISIWEMFPLTGAHKKAHFTEDFLNNLDLFS